MSYVVTKRHHLWILGEAVLGIVLSAEINLGEIEFVQSESVQRESVQSGIFHIYLFVKTFKSKNDS